MKIVNKLNFEINPKINEIINDYPGYIIPTLARYNINIIESIDFKQFNNDKNYLERLK